MILAAVSVLPAAAQDFKDLFDEFAKEARKDFEDFQNDANKQFADMLRESWDEFHLMTAVEPPRKPKPETLPVAPSDSLPSSVTLPEPESPGMKVPAEPAPEPQVDVVPDKYDPLSYPRESLTDISFSFYNALASMSIPKSIVNYHMRDCRETEVANYWDVLANDEHKTILWQIDQSVEKMGLSGWGRYMWVKIVSDVTFGEMRRNEREVFKTFMLNQMGVDARLGVVNGELTTMLAVKEQVYAQIFFTLDDRNYYLDKAIQNAESVFTYTSLFPEPVEPLSVEVTRPLRIEREGKTVTIERPSNLFPQPMTFKINTNHCHYYLDFPQVSVDVYARAAVDSVFSESLLAGFRPYLEGRTDLEKVSILMAYMHYDFEYAKDDDQFGFEKPFFAEENFVYPCNDCEDRSILFSYLVRNLVGLDVVLLDYPDHIATAVCFKENVAGDHFMYGGKRYVVCDPTYIGAPVGMTMEDYVDVEFKVLPLS